MSSSIKAQLKAIPINQSTKTSDRHTRTCCPRVAPKKPRDQGTQSSSHAIEFPPAIDPRQARVQKSQRDGKPTSRARQKPRPCQKREGKKKEKKGNV